jgi:hypothetical protein
MLGNTLFLIGIVFAVVIGFAYFRDLGDVSQMFMRVKRKHMIRFIRNEIDYWLSVLALRR